MVFTWSEDPYRDMWHHLMFLAKRDNARNLLSGNIPSNRSVIYNPGSSLDKKASQVSFGISQSSEYFRAADAVSVATSPLLYFYGMRSLAKSLVVANEADTYLENMMYHGLAKKSRDAALEAYEKDPQSWTMEAEFAVTRKGVFKHLTQAVSDFQYPDGSVITFKDLLAVCPEIRQMFSKYYGETSKTLYLHSFQETSKDPYRIQICPDERDESKIFQCIPEFATDFDMAPGVLHPTAKIFNSRDLKAFPDYLGIYCAVVGGRYIVGGLPYKVGNSQYKRYVDPLITDYVALYILSSCVRYKQDFWGSVLQGEKSGVLGLIELYLSVVRRRFPNLILDELFGQEFEYGVPGRWM
jgi:hypothetical protein